MQWYLTGHRMSLDSYFETAIPVETNLPELDFVTSNELSHYDIIISGSGLKSKVNYDEKKEYQVHNSLWNSWKGFDRTQEDRGVCQYINL